MGDVRWWVLLVAGCYHANGFAPCETRCDDGVCPDGQVCGSDLFCHGPTDELCTVTHPDGPLPPGIDASPPDAPYPCPAKYFNDFGAICPPPTDATVTIADDLDTDNDPRCTLYAQHTLGVALPAVCLITGGNIEVTTVTRVHGGRALALVATNRITIDDGAKLDVGSKSDLPGPSAAFDSCGLTSASDTTCKAHGGGSFGLVGGNGGNAQQAAGPGVMAQPAAMPPLYLRGGCPSDRFGNASSMQQTYDGLGGGAVYLAAHDTIEIDGTLTAGGAGGSAGSNVMTTVGAGGGGSGGMIVLEAPHINVVGFVAANGGGGASGKGTSDSVRGDDSDSAGAAMGGRQGSVGAGGSGSFGMAGMIGGNAATCGGGGGGGAGFIYLILRGTDLSGSQQFSPVAMQRVVSAD